MPRTDYSKNSTQTSESSNSINTILNVVGLIFLGFFVLTIGFVGGKLWGGGINDLVDSPMYKIVGKRDNQEVTELDFDKFWEVWGDLSSGYVEKDLPEEDMYYGAIKGMVAGIDDPATVFLTPEETEQYELGNQGKFEGIGAELGYEDGWVVVVTPLEGSPAMEAGIKAGDKIYRVDGEDVTNKDIYQVVDLIRGEKGSDVEITVIRNGAAEAKDITVTRGEITVASVSYEEKDGDVFVIDVDRFTEASPSAWREKWNTVVDEVIEEDPEGVVLDLRGNPGGYFSSAVWAAGEFLEKGDVVVKQRDRNGSEKKFSVTRDGRLQDVELVVLVDGGSASASEILAGALQHYDRAEIIGEDTYGKGTAQDIIEYTDGSSLHITIYKWILPDGRWLNPDDVIEPDTEVEFTEDNFVEGEDPQMDEALESLK